MVNLTLRALLSDSGESVIGGARERPCRVVVFVKTESLSLRSLHTKVELDSSHVMQVSIGFSFEQDICGNGVGASIQYESKDDEPEPDTCNGSVRRLTHNVSRQYEELESDAYRGGKCGTCSVVRSGVHVQ